MYEPKNGSKSISDAYYPPEIQRASYESYEYTETHIAPPDPGR